jgi:hypothetical protein
MINEIVPVDDMNKAIRERLVEYLGADTVRRAVDLDAIVHALEAFMDLDEDHDRELFIKGIGALVCSECGRPSCLHGYSDE